MRLVEWVIAIVASAVLLVGAFFNIFPYSIIEALGFITGAICVWLTVKQNIWNWPIGIANNLFYIVLFFEASLFADMSLQIVYVVLGGLGWYWWLHGGADHTKLLVAKTGLPHAIVLVAVTVIATTLLTIALSFTPDTAPFLDALTTVLSLVAQYMLTRKLLENWYVWITVDVIYIGLYIYKELYLTSFLYAIFLCMCIVGMVQWRKAFTATRATIAETPATNMPAQLKPRPGATVNE